METTQLANGAFQILLVEDNLDDIDLVRYALRQHGHTIELVVARDGVEALALLLASTDAKESAAQPPALILLDVKLPKIDGLEVLRRLRADPRTRRIPVVVMTTSAEERDIVAAYDLGVNSYIVKPVDFDQFTEVVKLVGRYWLLLNQAPPLTDKGDTQ